MTITEYSTAAQRTSNTNNPEAKLNNGLMGLCGEVGEAMDIWKKYCYQGHPLGKDEMLHMAKELGDIAWYLAEAIRGLCLRYDLKLLGSLQVGEEIEDKDLLFDEDIFKMNIEKLKARYPDKFDAELSMHRKEGDI